MCKSRFTTTLHYMHIISNIAYLRSSNLLMFLRYFTVSRLGGAKSDFIVANANSIGMGIIIMCVCGKGEDGEEDRELE